jgi:hypothetical protein
MLTESEISNRFRPAIEGRGFVHIYWQDQVNRCPGCGKSHWHIGRALAECGFCATALPLSGGSLVSWS